MNKPFILVIDDDQRLRELLQKYLQTNGCHVRTLDGAQDVRAMLSLVQVDLIILDIMMPKQDGLSLARWIRRAYNTPIILLTAVSEFDQKMTGFEIGVDDYITKPFQPPELLARIHAILRRRQTGAPRPTKVCQIGPYCCDLGSSRITSQPSAVPLSQAESGLLLALARQPNQPMSRDYLARQLTRHAQVRTIDVHMARLRKKIEDNPHRPRYLKTVRGHGYVLDIDG
ncbi:MAG: response regulator transcription factor [Pseudomonadota bacterium]